MAEDNMIRMPSSGGGIVRYFDDYTSKIELTPTLIVVLIVVVLVLEIILHVSGSSWFGL
ncbi:preprotein translocase subunit Sec61beta [Candidatus Woesearchaeota archaeon]|nr:preprotein translocase subunit Sec61beta [Candidatus Woesearchaeota archaeon]